MVHRFLSPLYKFISMAPTWRSLHFRYYSAIYLTFFQNLFALGIAVKVKYPYEDSKRKDIWLILAVILIVAALMAAITLFRPDLGSRAAVQIKVTARR